MIAQSDGDDARLPVRLPQTIVYGKRKVERAARLP